MHFNALANGTDIILADIRLPDISGYDVLQRLRVDARMADIPVIAVSENLTREDLASEPLSRFIHHTQSE